MVAEQNLEREKKEKTNVEGTEGRHKIAES
jgi:hypothetical protein